MKRKEDKLIFTGITLRESQRTRLEALAEKQDRSLSYLIRRAVESYLNRHKTEDNQ